jgi:hypothetical protein
VSVAGLWPSKSSYSSMDSLNQISTLFSRSVCPKHSPLGMKKKKKWLKGNNLVFPVVVLPVKGPEECPTLSWVRNCPLLASYRGSNSNLLKVRIITPAYTESWKAKRAEFD